MRNKKMAFFLAVILCISFTGCSCAGSETIVEMPLAEENVTVSTADSNDNPPALLPDTENNETDDGTTYPSPVDGTPFENHGKLSVSGTQVVDANGNPFQLCGVSTHGIGWFPEYVNEDSFRSLRDDFGANIVRLAMYTDEGAGYCTGGDRSKLKSTVTNGVDYATNLGMYVIVDWHVLHDLDPNKYKDDAKQFFDEISRKYADNENIIYEICNEPNGGTTWAQIKSYALEVIPVIRANDPDAIIIVGTPNWSQNVDEAVSNPISEYDNILYAVHFYADTHKDWLRGKVSLANDNGLAVIISEFGICDASGNGFNNIDEGNKWIEFLDQNKIGFIAWNLSNKNESSSLISSMCNKTSGWTYADLSESGQWLVSVLDSHTDQGSAIMRQAQSNPNGGGTAGANGNAGPGNGIPGSGKKTPAGPGNGNAGQGNNVPAGPGNGHAGQGNNAPAGPGNGNANQGNNQNSGVSNAQSGDLQVKVSVSNSWSDGTYTYTQYSVAVRNNGSQTISGWSLDLTFSGNISIDQIWCSTGTVNGSTLSLTPESYISSLSGGQTAMDIGFIVKSSGALSAPTITVNR